jgi:phosphatidate cytidylyltransferase
MFRTKVITALIGMPIFLALLVVGGVPLFIVASAILLLALSEFYNALQIRRIYAVKEAGYLCAMGILAATQFIANAPEWRSGVITTCIAAAVFLALIAQFRRRSGSSVIANSGATVFGVVYVGLLFSFLLRLRMVSLSTVPGIPDGGLRDTVGALLLVVLAVWATDSTAQLAGRAYGKTKAWPSISPNKTLEGALAGLIAAMVVTCGVGAWLHLPLSHMVLLGLSLGVLGEVGDLCKSQIKRELGIKDFGSIIPGHGGVLDRFDSLLFTMPVAYLYFRLFVMP